MSPWLSRNRIFEIVMSGNSLLRSARTSPIERWERSGKWLTLRRAAGEEDEPELADLDFIAVGECGLVDAAAVEVGPVQGSDVGDEVALARPAELGVAPRHRDVV